VDVLSAVFLLPIFSYASGGRILDPGVVETSSSFVSNIILF